MIKAVTRKSMKIRPSGRSSDFISPSFGFGCLLECSYCYMKRHKPVGLDYATNINTILDEINRHSLFTVVDKPNQTHPKYITYDIACNEDFALHSKYYDWVSIFNFFKEHPIAMGTFATKIIPKQFLKYNPEQKIRIRFSLMPQVISSILEPNTSKIIDRLKAVDTFIEAGYDVHLNFSPVVFFDNWLDEYKNLFNLVENTIVNKDKVLAEVIFLTHNVNKHKNNVENNIEGESLLWNPELQEPKKSQYGGDNIRYRWRLKQDMISDFKEQHKQVIPWNTIRYIF
tara:strand:+ start:38605 stop:39459 length:855 start_codon:yes stop_codon:yes gene_type:complete